MDEDEAITCLKGFAKARLRAAGNIRPKTERRLRTAIDTLEE